MAMKAIVQEAYGPPGEVLRLQDVGEPEPSSDEVLLGVRAAGVNWADYSITTGVPYMVRLGFGLRRPSPGKRVRGTDVAGVVERVGGDVDGLKVGDQVFGWCKGAFAERACVPMRNLALKPSTASFEQAAGVPMTGMVALQALRDVGNVQEGQKVLVNGASGGIGMFTVQVAKALGAEVTGVCSTKNVDFVRSIGADHVIDYTEVDFTEGSERYDFILDIADNRSFSARRRVLTPGGTLVPNSGEGGRLTGSLGRILSARVLSLFVKEKLHPFLSVYRRDDLDDLTEMIESGDVTPAVGRTFPLVETPDAVTYVGKRHARGKTVVIP
jgi:NADPH:quinone reductase-like Zn-dependent oxidoreductase